MLEFTYQFLVLAISFGVLVISMLLFNFWMMGWVEVKRIVPIDMVDNKPVAIVFGAGLLRSGEPTAVLRDRVQTAVKLYQTGKVQKILMTGDNSYVDYNEPAAMHQYALDLGVPDDVIVLDYAGRRTYDSCYRAKEIFGVNDAILVTQHFHLIRALFLCRHLGLEAVGVEADNIQFRRGSILFWNIREIPARSVAMADLIFRPKPILGNPEYIFPEEPNATQ